MQGLNNIDFDPKAFTNSYKTYERGGYKGRTGLSPLVAYPSTMGSEANDDNS